ncbi:MAG: HAMP domain-containing protein [Nitrososphaeria archaeon]|nr:HAMP domain-containing protein [Nitrosopumilaceae archaeon]NIP10140.1 HAMP domain-containing protein [Nitrosopumilaceae archaeon]NIP91504.1 HAMP domain-containing protein [Nitrososphaeria archaeon]NIS95339.1 HAMP domain-containing protein [Nitrosopumilaceae archaeon]
MLIGVLIVAAAFNLFLLYQDEKLGIFGEGSNQETLIQVLLGVDIATFFLVPVVIRQSLAPLESISKALARVKEGMYGEKVKYKGEDEIGELVSSFNVMSDTIKEKEEIAKRTDLAKDEFLAMITHELKTPLVPIQGYADILLAEHLGKLNPEQKNRLEIIKSSSTTLLGIISDLLDVQKLEIGKLRMKKEDSDIQDSIERSVNALLPQAETKEIQLTFSAKNFVIVHDPERIKQVITNLIKNALIAVESKKGKIQVLMEETPSDIKISVKDNGMGIPKDKQKDLFKKFYQVDATLTRERGGSGLGLAICKGIIDNHGGQISVESEEGKGAKFTFTIPKQSIAIA